MVAVETRPNPPADLLVCAERPAGVPAVDTANPGDPTLDGLERVFAAFGRNAARFDRLINYLAPGSCP